MHRILRASRVASIVATLLVLAPAPAPAPQCPTQEARLAVSGALSAGRNDTLVCSGFHRSLVEAHLITRLIDLDGVVLVAEDCGIVSPGEFCQASLAHSSALPQVAVCQVLTVGHDSFAVGTFNRDDPIDTSEASSDLQVAGEFEVEVCDPNGT